MKIISNIDKFYIILWIIFNFWNFEENIMGQNRKFLKLNKFNKYPKIFKKIKQKIIKLENINDYIEDPFFGDMISIINKNGFIHEHTDPSIEGFEHVRYNLCILNPSLGGETFYNKKRINLEEGKYVKCEVKYEHKTKKILSLKPRIIISFGFLISN